MATYKWSTIKEHHMAPEAIAQVRESAARELASLNLGEPREAAGKTQTADPVDAGRKA